MSDNQSTSAWTPVFLYLMLATLLAIIVALSGRMLLDWNALKVFMVFFYGAQLGLALAVVALLQLIFGFIKKRKAHIKTGFLTLVFALLPLGLSIAAVGPAGFKAPMIHDISTDLQDPPAFTITNSLRTADENSLVYAGESIAALQREAFPDIKPIITALSPKQSHAQALLTIDKLNWVLVVDDASTGIIEAYDKSSVFGFIDDVSIRIRATDGGSQIDLRSVSRVGEGDLGANAARIRQFFKIFFE